MKININTNINNNLKDDEIEVIIMYELEESLPQKSFIRISNSCIANVEHIESFDLSKIGNIIIKFVDGSIEYVSKRKISSIMKFLRERGN